MSVGQDNFMRKLYSIQALYDEDLISAYKTFTEKSDVISRDILEKGTKVREYLILSGEMKRYLRDIKHAITEFNNTDQNGSKTFFYYARFGGSKSQFSALLKDELIQEQEEDPKFPSKRLIFLDFPKVSDLSGSNVFSQLSAGCIRALARVLTNEKEYNEVFTRIQELMFDIQVGIISTSKKQEIYKLLDEISYKTGRSVEKETDQIRIDLDYVQFMNDEIIIKKSKEIIKILSDHQFILVWLFDELDQWFDLETGELSEGFRNISRLLHEIFELGNISKNIFLFFATKRVQALLDDHEKIVKLELSDAATRRFFRLHRNSSTLHEQGNYGDAITDAIFHFSAMSCAVKNIKHPKLTFYKFLVSFTEFHAKPEYKRTSRGHINSRILKILENYFVIEDEVQKGFELLKPDKKWIDISNAIPDIFSTILLYLDTSYPFERREIPVGSKRLDGIFKISKSGNQDIYVEIKLSKNLEKLRVDQILEAAVVEKKWVIFFVFGTLTKDEVLTKIKKELIKDGKPEYIHLIKPIVVDNLLAYAPMIGTQGMSLSNTNKAIAKYKSCASFIRQFSELTTELNAIFIEHKDQFPGEHQDETEIISQVTQDLSEIIVEKAPERVFVEPTIKPPKTPLNPIDRLVRETLLALKRKNHIPKNSKKSINVIKKAIKNPSLLQELDKIERQLLDKKILNNFDSTHWYFSKSVCDKGYGSTMSIDQFESFITNELTKKTQSFL